ncbi:hypothetical protein EV356DRAFT_359480 [Viridothelium virens]|uniref:Uncharacterized protein n=1 Tax=Viridothelium virens TaxID=1048519 RepID=A0A6A6HI28_VIRVR|nr:hypothetical protein EV356DRAFT_359480 [Viridothelium virens]
MMKTRKKKAKVADAGRPKKTGGGKYRLAVTAAAAARWASYRGQTHGTATASFGLTLGMPLPASAVLAFAKVWLFMEDGSIISLSCQFRVAVDVPHVLTDRLRIDIITAKMHSAIQARKRHVSLSNLAYLQVWNISQLRPSIRIDLIGRNNQRIATNFRFHLTSSPRSLSICGNPSYLAGRRMDEHTLLAKVDRGSLHRKGILVPTLRTST